MMSCSPERGPLRTYWNVGDTPGSVYVGQDFGRRLLMTRHRFENITAALSFSGRDDNLAVDDVSFKYHDHYHCLCHPRRTPG